MSTIEFKQAIDNLFPLKYSGEFVDELRSTLNKYISLVKDYESASCDISEIEDLCTELLSVVSLYYDGRRGEAYRVFSQIMNGDAQNKGLFSYIDSIEINVGENFFRARKRIIGEEFSIKDMFHIPLNKRGIVSTQRYSYPGYPCLYLGNSVFSCYEELRRANFNDLMFSAYKVLRNFKVFDMRIPSEKDYSTNENLKQTLRRLPLVLACSFVVRNDNDVFKPEYIIPQMLIECIIFNNRMLTETGRNILDIDMIWGVIYTSTHINNDFPYGTDYLQNIVLPIIQLNGKSSYCEYLAALFGITKPLCYEYESLKEKASCIHELELGNQLQEQYKNSKMGYLEERLKNVEFESLSHLCLNLPNEMTINLDWSGTSQELEIMSNLEWKIE